jgi:hypothetical protein
MSRHDMPLITQATRHTAKHRPWFIDVVISGNFWRLPQAELGSVVSNCVAWEDWP